VSQNWFSFVYIIVKKDAKRRASINIYIFKTKQMARKKISVLKESETWRNELFKDNYTQEIMTREQFVKQIELWNYDNYHIRNINGIDTPVSNPDETELNNLD